MNAIGTQAAGLEQIIDSLRAMRPHMKAMGDALNRRNRLDELVEIETFISQASRLECKHVINMLIDRVSTLDGLAPELEDAAYSLTCSIEADDDAADSQ